ncbi:MAG TPA: hypothetical protein PKV91_04800 [Bacillota bacterium]|jgi:hypothetical protein|nr:hypothetical protein [Bacillota bacterium]
MFKTAMAAPKRQPQIYWGNLSREGASCRRESLRAMAAAASLRLLQ